MKPQGLPHKCHEPQPLVWKKITFSCPGGGVGGDAKLYTLFFPRTYILNVQRASTEKSLHLHLKCAKAKHGEKLVAVLSALLTLKNLGLFNIVPPYRTKFCSIVVKKPSPLIYTSPADLLWGVVNLIFVQRKLLMQFFRIWKWTQQRILAGYVMFCCQMSIRCR
jgi:hypothetical protein